STARVGPSARPSTSRVTSGPSGWLIWQLGGNRKAIKTTAWNRLGTWASSIMRLHAGWIENRSVERDRHQGQHATGHEVGLAPARVDRPLLAIERLGVGITFERHGT